jgi:hypothetical protein
MRAVLLNHQGEMMNSRKWISQVLCALSIVVFASGAAAQQRPPYGTAINLETAKRVAAGAVA